MYRIIALDLDGTLLSSNNKITKYTKKIIHLLVEKNFYFILASGRHFIDILKIKNNLKIKSFIIASNGAEIYNLDNKLIFSKNLEENIASNICRIKYLDKDIITQLFKKNEWYINNNNIENKFCSSLSILKYKYFHPDNFQFNDISKVFFTSKNFQKLCALEKNIFDCWNNKVNISFSIPGCLEIMSGNISKGVGLKLICNLLKISLNQCVAFGDGMNDQEMLSISGKSYIMKNADLRLKNVLPCSEIIESNNDDGVAKCLNKMFIKNKCIENQ